MSLTVDSASLSAFMDAVTEYYGADVWQGISSNAEFYAGDFAAKVTQVDGVSAMYNNAGDVLYYTYNGQVVGAGETVGNVINSNVGNVVSNTSVKVPANTTISQGGRVAAESGMKTVATGTAVKTVVKDVALSVAAVGAGIQLGATIDSLLYNANPDFWNEHGMSSLDPQTWDTLCRTEGGKTLFNFVFGIDKSTGKTQAYLDQNTFAYMAAYLASQGAFGQYNESVDIDDPTGLNLTGTTLPYSLTSYYTFPTGHNFYYGDNQSDVRMAGFWNGDEHYVVMVSDAPFNGYMEGHYSYPEVTAAHTVTVHGETFYLCSYLYGGSSAPMPPYNACTSGYNYNDVAYVIYMGDVSQDGGVEGITPQEGATQPTGIITGMSIAQVLAYLQTLYPDLFDDAIYNDTVQPDGTVRRVTYVPIGIPDNIDINEVTGAVQPTGGVDSLQDQTAIEETSPLNVVQTLLDLIYSTNPQSPTQTPTDVQTDYPDTGEGTTPTVILPTGGASALYSIYNPTQAQINSLGAWLWSSNFVDQLLKLFNDPMQAIIGLHKVFATPPTSGVGNIKVGYLDSGVSANLVSAQYTEVNCGSVSLREYFGNALDYTDTDIYLYLPFVGIVPVSAQDVTRATINVKYKVDVLTGACLAQVYVNRDNNAGGQLYCYAGDCAVKYPLSSGSYMGIVASVIGIAGSVAGTIASGGAMLPLALGAGASALNGARTRVEHSGQLTGNAGAMGIKKPYFIIRRPQTKIATNFETLNGVSQNEYGVLGSYTGFTRVKYVHLENIPATSEELTEIESYLKNGVML